MHRAISLVPFILFLLVFLGSGIYYHFQGADFAFYQIPPAVAILPAIILAFILAQGTLQTRVDIFIKGVGNSNILTMCVIFLLAGAFGVVTKNIGCIDTVVHMTLSFLPQQALLPGIFLISAFVSLSVGTSMGVIAALTPMAVGFADHCEIPLALAVGTTISGAMFGDNLSMISDTTIAAVETQGAKIKDKFYLNAIIASGAGFVMLILLFFLAPDAQIHQQDFPYTFIKATPYFLIIALALLGFNVFAVLVCGILSAGLLGFMDGTYNLGQYAQDISAGFASMNDIFILSLLVGGLSAFMKAQGGIQYIMDKIETITGSEQKNGRRAQFMIGMVVSINDICIANNTIAIILSGDIAKRIAKRHRIPAYKSACWLSIFSCAFQGIIPYSAQILLASSLSGVSPLVLATNVYYSYLLAIFAILYIIFAKRS